MTDDLIKRLRNFAQGCRGSMWQSRDETIELCDQAAAALEAAQAEVAALIREAEARGYNNGMLSAISVVAEERNKRNPGPLFEVLNKALGKIDDARFSAIRKV